MAIDLPMTIVLIGLMAYSLIGTLTHEILGTAMVILFTVHHILNRRWFGALPKGRYNSFRVFQTVLVFLMIGSVLASAVSGIMLSEHLYTFLPVSKGTSIARSVHMVCAYLNYILMSLHLGLHWNIMLSAMRKNNDQKSKAGRWAMRSAAVVIAVYGIYAFFRRQIAEYFFLRTHFLFLDPSEPIIFFFLDYMAVMGLLVCIGHCLAELLKKADKKKQIRAMKGHAS